MNQRSLYLKLTARQRIYVDCRLEGMTQVASAAAAGIVNADQMEACENVQAAMVERMQSLADAVDFSRKDAHDMYMQAYTNADTATEQIAAVTAMVKLHGLEKPRVLKVEHKHEHTGVIEHMSTEELIKLADMSDLILDAEYTDITEAPLLGAPEATDDNTKDSPAVPKVSDDY